MVRNCKKKERDFREISICELKRTDKICNKIKRLCEKL